MEKKDGNESDSGSDSMLDKFHKFIMDLKKERQEKKMKKKTETETTGERPGEGIIASEPTQLENQDYNDYQVVISNPQTSNDPNIIKIDQDEEGALGLAPRSINERRRKTEEKKENWYQEEQISKKPRMDYQHDIHEEHPERIESQTFENRNWRTRTVTNRPESYRQEREEHRDEHQREHTYTEQEDTEERRYQHPSNEGRYFYNSRKEENSKPRTIIRQTTLHTTRFLERESARNIWPEDQRHHMTPSDARSRLGRPSSSIGINPDRDQRPRFIEPSPPRRNRRYPDYDYEEQDNRHEDYTQYNYYDNPRHNENYQEGNWNRRRPYPNQEENWTDDSKQQDTRTEPYREQYHTDRRYHEEIQEPYREYYHTDRRHSTIAEREWNREERKMKIKSTIHVVENEQDNRRRISVIGHSFVQHLEKEIRRRSIRDNKTWEECLDVEEENVKISVKGISGANLDLFWKLRHYVEDNGATRVVIDLGTVDLHGFSLPETVARKLIIACDYMMERNPMIEKILLCLATERSEMGSRQYWKKEDFNTRVKDFNLYLVDLMRDKNYLLSHVHTGLREPTKELMWDGLHPEGEGMERYIDSIGIAIRRVNLD
jgi:hypothetical protein